MKMSIITTHSNNYRFMKFAQNHLTKLAIGASMFNIVKTVKMCTVAN